MRIRSIKPEFWSSEDIAAHDWPTRLLFVGLWQYVDDNGVGRDVEKLICADLFPLEDDPRETLATVSRGLQHLFSTGLIVRYVTADGRPFLYVTGWEHQKIDRPNKPRYPLPTSENAVIRETLATPSRGLGTNVASVTGEQRNRGTEEQALTTLAADASEIAPKPDRFAEFYETYPRKAKRPDALKAWTSVTRKGDADQIIAGAARFAADPNRDPQFTPYPATWLRAESWNDPACLPRQSAGAPSRGSTADQRLTNALSVSQRLEAEERQHSNRQPLSIGR
ncbi:hypothetical protein SAMN04515671_2946 [Nakamurella panacisegetis]|uniref:Uncharacterized protein n=1 Tax=Nakamurella panacisegetis TaxID=1090615 RepID=A0A1H0PZF1_9ACTN|nr:hypothetical protein [Nakamurella panacisegetis]SDP10532.1 hypothetical protein SAMN04515671_2946 [Nakamurella panacisegetis]